MYAYYVPAFQKCSHTSSLVFPLALQMSYLRGIQSSLQWISSSAQKMCFVKSLGKAALHVSSNVSPKVSGMEIK